MNIKVIREDDRNATAITGGEYCVSTLDIHVDKNLDIRTQRSLVIHGIIENYCPSWPHEKVEELEDLLSEGMEQLDEGKEMPHRSWYLKEGGK